MPPIVMNAEDIMNSSQFRSSSFIELMTLVSRLLTNNLGLKSEPESMDSSMKAVLAPFMILSMFIFRIQFRSF